MKKLVTLMIAIAVLGGVIFNIKFALKIDRNSELSLATMVALADDEGSNNNGGNPYYYEHLLGQPKECTLYKAIDVHGNVKYGDDESGFGVGWTVYKITGIKELCPKSGDGCTVYSCRETP